MTVELTQRQRAAVALSLCLMIKTAKPEIVSDPKYVRIATEICAVVALTHSDILCGELFAVLIAMDATKDDTPAAFAAEIGVLGDVARETQEAGIGETPNPLNPCDKDYSAGG